MTATHSCSVRSRPADCLIAEANRSRPIHPGKRMQLRKMAGRWLIERRERPFATDLRFDAIGVSFDPHGELVGLEHVENAF